MNCVVPYHTHNWMSVHVKWQRMEWYASARSTDENRSWTNEWRTKRFPINRRACMGFILGQWEIRFLCMLPDEKGSAERPMRMANAHNAQNTRNGFAHFHNDARGVRDPGLITLERYAVGTRRQIYYTNQKCYHSLRAIIVPIQMPWS